MQTNPAWNSTCVECLPIFNSDPLPQTVIMFWLKKKKNLYEVISIYSSIHLLIFINV